MTPIQNRMLTYIREYIATHGHAPSFAEMGEGLGIKSKSQVSMTLDRLERQGFIRRMRDTARAIEIVDNPKLPVADFLSHEQLVAEVRRHELYLCERFYRADGYEFVPIATNDDIA